MQRFGRVVRLKPGKEQEYEEAHKTLWAGVRNALDRSGILNYSIYRYGQWLFSYFELPDNCSIEHVAEVFGKSHDCVKWEERMHKLQEPLPESGNDSWWVPMEEVFHFDAHL